MAVQQQLLDKAGQQLKLDTLPSPELESSIAPR